jgi:hypothetical protein
MLHSARVERQYLIEYANLNQPQTIVAPATVA